VTTGDAAHVPDEVFGALMSPAGRQDPWPHLRSLTGVACSHADAVAAMRDRRFGAVGFVDPDRPLFEAFNRWVISRDGPAHEALRRRLVRAFSKSAIASYEPLVAATVDGLLGALPEHGEGDLLASFAFPAPLQVIVELMDLPEDVRDGIPALMHDLNMGFVRRDDPAYLDRADRALAALLARLRPAFEERREAPSTDMLSRLAARQDDDTDVNAEDLLLNAVFLLQAGHETTANTIASGTYALLAHPEQLAALRADPGLLPAALEEVLRFHSPIGMAPRMVLEDATLPAGEVSAGQVCWFFLGAVNRDPSVFADPDRFDIVREPNPHLAFAVGPHQCLGAPLGRLTSRVALRAIVERFPDLRLTGEPRWAGVVPFRGLESLPVAW
jgi:pimeloyl-[acyl-carrier protein] synthase